MSDLQPRLLRVSQCAKIMNLSRTSIYEMIYSGQLKAVRGGGKGTAILVPVEAIDEWIETAKQAAANGVVEMPINYRK